MTFKRSLFILIFLSTTPLWAMSHLSTQETSSPMIGLAAPDVVLGKTDGHTTSVIGSRKGKKAILIFWATWCPHCYEELGDLNGNLASIEQQGIEVILVDIGETKDDVNDYFKKRKMKLESFVDENSYLQGAYHLIGVPTLVFIDQKGIIRSVTHEFPSDYQDFFKT